MREDIENMKREVQKIQEQSVAMGLLKEQQKQNKRLFIIILVILGMFTCLLGYTIYLLTDIEIVETTSEVYDVEQESGDNSNNNFITGDYNEVNN